MNNLMFAMHHLGGGARFFFFVLVVVVIALAIASLSSRPQK